MNLGMTKIYKFQDDISTDALKELERHSSLAIDTEGTGLQIPHRDKLSFCLLYTSPSPRDGLLSRMPSSA